MRAYIFQRISTKNQQTALCSPSSAPPRPTFSVVLFVQFSELQSPHSVPVFTVKPPSVPFVLCLSTTESRQCVQRQTRFCRTSQTTFTTTKSTPLWLSRRLAYALSTPLVVVSRPCASLSAPSSSDQLWRALSSPTVSCQHPYIGLYTTDTREQEPEFRVPTTNLTLCWARSTLVPLSAGSTSTTVGWLPNVSNFLRAKDTPRATH